MLINFATKETRIKCVSVVFSIVCYLLVTGHVEELCQQQQTRADMQKPVGFFVHRGSTFWHIVQDRRRHDDSKVQRFDSNGPYAISNALSSYPSCSKIKIYFSYFPKRVVQIHTLRYKMIGSSHVSCQFHKPEAQATPHWFLLFAADMHSSCWKK